MVMLKMIYDNDLEKLTSLLCKTLKIAFEISITIKPFYQIINLFQRDDSSLLRWYRDDSLGSASSSQIKGDSGL